MSKFIYVTNHAVERFKDRLNRQELDREACIRIISAMAHNGIDFAGNVGTDMYKLCTFKSYKEGDTEIVLVLAKDYNEEMKRSSLVVKTLLTKDQAMANISLAIQKNRHISKESAKRIAM